MKIREALLESPLSDITEYSRAVHAEMEALLFCARNHISLRGCTLYCTTHPCHTCAKLIIAAGISRVVYIEPYPKSKALELHKDAISSGILDAEDGKISFEPFVGVGPRLFFDLFSMKLGSGRPLERKNKDGRINQWPPPEPKKPSPRIPFLPITYLKKENLVADNITNLLSEDDTNKKEGE